MKKSKILSPWFTYGVPMALWVYMYLWHGYRHLSGNNLYRESGLIENLTALFLLAAVIYFLICLKYAKEIWEKAWLLMLAVGAFYFLGEEISWGYHLLHYGVSDQWAALNDQKEPNLHNLKGFWEILLDKLPRQVLSIGTITGGLMGWWANRRENWLNFPSIRRLIPESAMLFTAVLASLVSAPEKIMAKTLPVIPEILHVKNDAGELKECLLAFFIMLYAYVLWKRFRDSRITDHTF